MKLAVMFFFLSAILISCDEEKKPENFNMYGSADRCSSYEHIGSFDRDYVHEIDVDAKDKSGVIAPPLSLDNSELIAATENGSITLLDTKGAKWEYATGGFVITGMAADNEKNAYAVLNTGKLISISYKGERKWETPIESFNHDTLQPYSDLLVVNDGLILASESGLIIKYSLSGKKLWSRKHTISPLHIIAADEKGNLVLPLTHDDYGQTDSLYFISPKGKTIWAKGFPDRRLIKMVCIRDGRIFIPAIKKDNETSLSIVYGIDSTGKTFWEKKLSIMPRYISVSTKGDIYIGGFNAGLGESYSGVFAFNKKLKPLWQTPFNGGAIAVPLLISKDEAALVLSTYNGIAVYYLDTKDGVVNKSISLTDAPPVNLQPVVVEGGVLMFIGSEELKIVELPGKAF